MNSISINVGAQQTPASSRSGTGAVNAGDGKTPVNGPGQNKGKFAEHFSEVPADDVESSKLPDAAEASGKNQSSVNEASDQDLSLLIEVEGQATNEEADLIDTVETIVAEVAPEGTGDDSQQMIESDNSNGDPVAVPVVIGQVQAEKQAATATPLDGKLVSNSTTPANARNLTGRRENVKTVQEGPSSTALADGESADEAEAPKSARVIDGPQTKNADKAATGDAKPQDAKLATGSAGRAEAPANGASTFNLSGGRGAENRLTNMMEASSAFASGSKISLTKQENHVLPAVPQQLTVSGMSRTVVSQVLELGRSGELEQNGSGAKTVATGPVKIIEVQLVPRNLGPVGISIRNVGGRVTISIETQSIEAERLIRTEVDKIAGAIRQAGQVVEDISVKRSVQTTQQSDLNSGDQGSNRQSGANINQNSNNPLWQSSNDEKGQSSQRESIDEIETQGGADISSTSGAAARQGIYL